jgi:Mn-containing catalase
MAYATLAYDISGDVANDVVADVRADVAADVRADVAYVLLYATSLVTEVQRIILLEIAKDTRTEELAHNSVHSINT